MNDFQKMFYRILKEYDIPNKKYIMRYFLTNSVTKQMISNSSMIGLYVHIFSEQKMNSLLDNILIKKMNQLFFIYSIKHIIAFLKKYKIYDIFEQNITKYNGLTEYFEHMAVKEYSPFKVIIHAFTWAQTKEGQAFWENIHKLFISDLAQQLTKKK